MKRILLLLLLCICLSFAACAQQNNDDFFSQEVTKEIAGTYIADYYTDENAAKNILLSKSDMSEIEAVELLNRDSKIKVFAAINIDEMFIYEIGCIAYVNNDSGSVEIDEIIYQWSKAFQIHTDVKIDYEEAYCVASINSPTELQVMASGIIFVGKSDQYPIELSEVWKLA